MRTRHLRLVTSEHSDTTHNRESALSPYGPVKVGLTTWPTTNDQALTELLSSLEKKVAELIYKSSTVCDTLNTATQAASVALFSTQTAEVGIEIICNECGDDLVAEGESKCLECLEALPYPPVE